MDKAEEVKGWLKLINEFPIDYVAEKICQLFAQAQPDEINPYALPSQAYDEYFTPPDELLLTDEEIDTAWVDDCLTTNLERDIFRHSVLVAKAQLAKAQRYYEPLLAEGARKERGRIINWLEQNNKTEFGGLVLLTTQWQALKGEKP